MKKYTLLLFANVFFTLVFSQPFYNEIKSNKGESPLMIKELSTKEIIVAVSLLNTDTNYTIYKLDEYGHILKNASFSIVDSVWTLKTIHETSYGYLLVNQIHSKANRRKVLFKFIAINKNLSPLFNRYYELVDSATTSHDVYTNIDELNGRFVSLSTINFQSSISQKFYYKTVQYDENGVVTKTKSFGPDSVNYYDYGFQKIKLKADGSANGFVCYNKEIYQLKLDSDLNVASTSIPKNAEGNGLFYYGVLANRFTILNDTTFIFYASDFDSSGYSNTKITKFTTNHLTSFRLLNNGQITTNYATDNNLKCANQTILSAVFFEGIGSNTNKIIVSKLDDQLNTIWEKEIVNSRFGVVRDVTILKDGGCLALAYIYDSSNKQDVFIVKVSNSGVVSAINNISAQKHQIKLYPNPGSKLVSVEGIEVENITFFDRIGHSFQLKILNNTFDVEALLNGIYFYEIINKYSGETVTGKWLKE